MGDRPKPLAYASPRIRERILVSPRLDQVVFAIVAGHIVWGIVTTVFVLGSIRDDWFPLMVAAMVLVPFLIESFVASVIFVVAFKNLEPERWFFARTRAIAFFLLPPLSALGCWLLHTYFFPDQSRGGISKFQQSMLGLPPLFVLIVNAVLPATLVYVPAAWICSFRVEGRS